MLKMNKLRKVRSVIKVIIFLDFWNYKKSRSKNKEIGNYLIDE